jgi:hypothetical protein
LEKRVDQKLIMYDNKAWILFDIIYYSHQIFYWIWIFFLLFTKWKFFGILLIILFFLNSIRIWILDNKYDNLYHIIKIIVLFLLIVAPFFSGVLQ